MSGKTVEATGRTIEAAEEKGLETLGIKISNARVEVLEEPGSGFFGLWGNKLARVRVSTMMEPEQYLQHLLKMVIREIDPHGNTFIEKDNENYSVSIRGERMGALIGKRGKTLNSLQYLVNVIMHRQFKHLKGRVVLDIENYRQRRENYCRNLASDSARKAVKTGKEIALEPMPSHERRIIHLTLKDDPGVKTVSTGEEPRRKVVITPQK